MLNIFIVFIIIGNLIKGDIGVEISTESGLIYVDEKIEEYVLNLVFATRKPEDYNLPELKGLIDYGGSPRASINLTLAAKSSAFLEHRGYVTPEDIRYIGMDVLRHRVILSYEAEAEEMTSEDIIQRLYDTIEIP